MGEGWRRYFGPEGGFDDTRCDADDADFVADFERGETTDKARDAVF